MAELIERPPGSAACERPRPTVRGSSARPDPQTPGGAHIIVVTLLRCDGSTGVETHIHNFLQAAADRNCSAELVTPYSATGWRQRLCNFVVNRWKAFDSERAHLWLRRVYRRRVRRHLAQAVSRHRTKRVIVYAQDPLSTELAVSIKAQTACRVVSVAHFNVSEADEFVDNGIAPEGGSLWQDLRETEHAALPRVDRLIFVSAYMRQRVCKRIPALRLVDTPVIPNFSPARACPHLTVQPSGQAIAIGTLEPRKNQAFLIHVIAQCKKQGVRLSLDIVGDGPDRTALEALVRKLGVDDQVRFLGFVRNAADLIPDYQVLLHAATMESFGIVLIEAMACATPVVAHPVGGVPEVFHDGIEGLYWAGADIPSASAQLVALLKDDDRYRQMRVAARRRFETHFDANVLADQWLESVVGRPFRPVNALPA